MMQQQLRQLHPRQIATLFNIPLPDEQTLPAGSTMRMFVMRRVATVLGEHTSMAD
jgi:hypothetical protein